MNTKTQTLHLDALASRTSAELANLYAGGTVPDTLAFLDGDLVGRMLAVHALDAPPLAFLVTHLARHHGFPWGGKSFAASSRTTGSGINRVRLFGEHRIFPFTTRVEPSHLDGKPCVVLDYDQVENPGFIRAIHDEVREVESGLFLGPACLKRFSLLPPLRSGQVGGPLRVLWFALDARGAHVLAWSPCQTRKATSTTPSTISS